MRSIKYIFIVILSSFIFSGCVGQFLNLPLSEEEAFKYDKQYLAEYEKIKEENKNIEIPFKWIQAKNKKEECMVYVSMNPNDDKTIKTDYALYWDGECTNGYASGLGREIEKTNFNYLEQIGFYENGKAVDYCTMNDQVEGVTIDGECNYDDNKTNHNVITQINNKNGNLNISYRIGASATKNSPEMLIQTSPFSDVQLFIKGYPNFVYSIVNYSKDEFAGLNYRFSTKIYLNNQWINNGYVIEIPKQGAIYTGEVINGKLVKKVELPQSYMDNVNSIHNEIKKHVNIALEAQQKAIAVKDKYKNKICKDSVKVDFMDNSEYKEICNEDKKFEELRKKIDEKLANIEQQKQAKRNQLTQQQQLQLQQAQLEEQKRRNNSQSLQQGLQNFNNSLNQMNQQSNQIYNNSMQQMNDASRNFNNSNEKKYYYMQQTAPNLYYVK